MFNLFKKKKKGGRKKLGLRYIDRDTPVHRLDPRAKLFMLILLSIVVFLLDQLTTMMILFVIIMGLTLIARITGDWLRSMAKLIPFLIILVILSTFFSKIQSGHLYFEGSIWILYPQLTDGSIMNGLTIGLRFLSLMGASVLFLMTTKFEDFVKGLRKLKVPVTFSFSLGLALRSMTYLSADVKNILDAQRSRGLEIDRKDLIRNYVKFLSLFVPIIVCLLTRSQNISEAAQSRAFGNDIRPTMYRELRMRASDYGFMLSLGLISSLLVLL